MPSSRPEVLVPRAARRRYQLADLLGESGGVDLADLAAVRRLAQRLNADRDLAREPERGVRAGELHALGLIFERSWRLLRDYRSRHPELLRRALDWLVERHGEDAVDRALRVFAALYRAPDDAEDDDDLPGARLASPADREEDLEDLLLVWLVNANPATAPVRELCADDELEAASGYRTLVADLEEFFAAAPPVDEEGTSLFAALGAPAAAAPESLAAQLESVLEEHRPWIEPVTPKLLLGLDVLREEEHVFLPGPPPPPPVQDFTALEGEARYSADADWMGALVLVAKNVLVWLDQLSRVHDREISRLDQIPAAELSALRRQGFTGLWLIGAWQRSAASQMIKELTGNREAAASAYAVEDYRVADELGGEKALAVLRARASRAGLRLACDMVPNHTGIDSRWLREHPERFLSLAHCPFPNYTFKGPDLSSDPRIAIHLEDGYYDRRDAAVVFRRADRRSGETRYVYHGNDGTALPWNDTAQLDYLKAETREAVIRTILEVARRFPIIRFDAAMTLARQHVQRLWHPPPGSGGEIPSRAEHAVSPELFDRAMPEELWREVVDRMAVEAPGTLLLAEAFWLMEGYFVRTLGMHRVYNSAFMHTLKDGDNGKLRKLIENALAFDPGILQRFVNFLTNPDEATAIEQFGKGDRYFGVALLLVTLPGLPLFGHGQVEGLAERYGMEYRRAHLDERPDADFVAHHQRVLAPLLERRALFAGAEHFELYPAETPDGTVVEDVYAFTNRRISGGPRLAGRRDERVLVLYHHADATVRVRVRHAAERRDRVSGELRRATLAAALGLEDDGAGAGKGIYLRFRDLHRELEYLRPARQLVEQGLDFELGPYGFRVLVDFKLVRDRDGRWRRLRARIGEEGVTRLEEALRGERLASLDLPLRTLFTPSLFRRLLAPGPGDDEAATGPDGEPERAARLMVPVLATIAEHPELELGGPSGAPREIGDEVAALLAAWRRQLGERAAALAVRLAPAEERRVETEGGSAAAVESAGDESASEAARARGYALLAWILVHRLGRLRGGEDVAADSRALFDQLMLGPRLDALLRELGVDRDDTERQLAAIKLFVRHQGWWRDLGPDRPAADLAHTLFADDEVLRFLGVNRYDGVLWFDRDGYRELAWWLLAIARLELRAAPELDAAALRRVLDVVRALQAAEEPSGYRVEDLLARLASAEGR